MCCNLQNKSEDEKFRIAIKLHHQFAHPRSDKLKSLLKDAQISDKTLEKHLDNLDDTCDARLRYIKPKPRPVVELPMARTFNETAAMDLKHWAGNTWLLHLIDHATRYSSSCVIHTKKKEEVMKNLSQNWLTIFGNSNRFLVDNGGEFCNEEFITFCENSMFVFA